MCKTELEDINIMIKEIDELIIMCGEVYFTSFISQELKEYKKYFKTLILDMLKQRRNLTFLKRNYKCMNSDISLGCIIITLKDYIYEYIKNKVNELDNYLTVINLSFENISVDFQSCDDLDEVYCDSISSMMLELRGFKKSKKMRKN